MALRHPDERASRIQTATVFRLVGSWTQQLRPKPKPQDQPKTLLQEEINTWVNEGGRVDDEGP